MGEGVALILAAFALGALLIHLFSVLLVARRFLRPAPTRRAGDCPPLTVLRPVCGAEPGLAETLASTFVNADSTYEVIFCIASQDDAAIPLVQGLIATHPEVDARLLIGDERISGNPKLNNLAKGWEAARNDWIVMIDSNVLLPRDYIQTLFGRWTGDAGLVSSPPAGIRPEGVWGSVEAGFLNTYQDRWQLTSDQLGNGFAQGKVLMWHRPLLEAAGGLAALGRNLAEDVAATKIVRAAGRRVHVLMQPFPQPLGRRSAREVVLRQVRWARVRRDGFPALFAAEILSVALLPFAAVAALAIAGLLPPGLAIAYPLLWYVAEWGLAQVAGWPSSAGQVAAWLLRDLLIPAIWAAAFASRGFVWRGNAMHENDRNQTPAG